jgi:hypothetical protein
MSEQLHSEQRTEVIRDVLQEIQHQNGPDSQSKPIIPSNGAGSATPRETDSD